MPVSDALCVPLNAAIYVRERELGELAYQSGLPVAGTYRGARPAASDTFPYIRARVPLRVWHRGFSDKGYPRVTYLERDTARVIL